jgi:hypothetical protein
LIIATELAQALRDDSRCAVHVVLQFRVHVQVAPPRGHIIGELGNTVDDWHGSLRRRQ